MAAVSQNNLNCLKFKKQAIINKFRKIKIKDVAKLDLELAKAMEEVEDEEALSMEKAKLFFIESSL